MQINLNKRNFWQAASRFFIAAVCVLFVASARGEGFRNPPAGTFDLGRAGGRIAQVDDPSAVQHNPANMPDLTNTELQITPSVVYMKVNYTSSTVPGATAETQSPVKVLPNLFAVIPFANGRAAAGLGITVPYGLSMEWNQNSSAFNPNNLNGWRYFGTGGTPYFAALITVNVNPSVAVKLGEHFSLGAGLDVMWSSLQFKTYITPIPVGGDPADAYGTGVGVGGNVALTWRITDRQRLALAYRSPLTVHYDGTFSQALAPNQSDFRSEIKYPTIVSVGYAWEFPHDIRLESDVEWLQFSRFANLPVSFAGTSATLAEDWHNTFTAGIAGDWKFARHWVVRAGYQYYESPVPNHTFSPLIPDADQNVMTLGLGWQSGHNSFQIAYGLDFYNDRNISNDQFSNFNGKYTFAVHLFSAAYTYTF